MPTTHIDLAVAWNWPYDRPFVTTLAAAAQRADLSFLLVGSGDVRRLAEDLRNGSTVVRTLLDRASDEDDAFLPLVHEASALAAEGECWFVNAPEQARRAADKATMHLEFIEAGIHVPYTIILSPLAGEGAADTGEPDIGPLGAPFVIKPATTTGGGVGVSLSARTHDDIRKHRERYPSDKLLLQRRVVPAYLSETRAWFRVFFGFGSTFLCWWDDQTHVYEPVTPEEEAWFGLGELRRLVTVVARLTGLDFFSSEFAQTPEATFVSVDYVNELCDMRPKSTAADGVPDELLAWVVDGLCRAVRMRPTTDVRPEKGLRA